jgi:Fe-Mn family superoxide dismutase
MYIHLNMHHKAYVDNLNKAIAGTEDTNARIEQILINAMQKTELVRNNAGGHYNHSLFWELLSPNAAKAPSDELTAAIKLSFGSVDSLKNLIQQTAMQRFGSGWVWLILTPEKKLRVCSTANQDNPLMDKPGNIRGIPILCIDLWEHAYYLNYQNRRTDYLKAMWNVLDWNAVSKKYSEALTSPLMQYLKTEKWASFKNFHSALQDMLMNMKKGEITPVRMGSANLLKLAKLLSTDPIPTEIEGEDVRTAIKSIIATCTEVNDIVIKKGTDDALKNKFMELREPVRIIVEKSRKSVESNNP